MFHSKVAVIFPPCRFSDAGQRRAQAGPGLLQRLPVQVSRANQDTLLQLTGVSAALALWSLAQVLPGGFSGYCAAYSTA